ncbi:hypothetical protein BDF22DRAFT_477633 [Syncephalis plumigaleata]|nr:hypothetical protein BDF22DRAFT_477633 [Syncephalis plumigaleata]
MNNHIWMEVVASNHPSSVSPPQLNVHGGTSRTHRGRIQSPLKMTTNSSSTAVFTTSSPPHTANSSTVPATSNQSTTIAPSSITPSYRMAMNRRPHSKSFSNATDVIRRSYTPPPPASSSSSLMSSGALSHSRSSTPPVMHSANHSIISNGLHPLGRSSHTNSSPSPHGTPMVACHTFSYPQQSAIINGHVNNITTTNTGNTNGNVILVSRPMTPSSSITSTTSNSATVPVTTTSTAHNTHMNHNHKTMFMGSNVTRQSNHSRNSSSGHSSNCSSNCSNSTNNNNNSNTNASQLSCTPSIHLYDVIYQHHHLK